MLNESSFTPSGKEGETMKNLVPRRKWQTKPPEALRAIAHGQKSFVGFGDPKQDHASQQTTNASSHNDWKLHTGPDSPQQIEARKRVEELKKRG